MSTLAKKSLGSETRGATIKSVKTTKHISMLEVLVLLKQTHHLPQCVAVFD